MAQVSYPERLECLAKPPQSSCRHRHEFASNVVSMHALCQKLIRGAHNRLSHVARTRHKVRKVLEYKRQALFLQVHGRATIHGRTTTRLAPLINRGPRTADSIKPVGGGRGVKTS